MAPDSSSDDEDSIPSDRLLQPFKSPFRAEPPNKFISNDLVWAKLAPQSWFPAQIITIVNDSTVLASLFDSNKTQLLKFSQISGFEENFVRIVNRAGTKQRIGIDVALEELGRRAALSVMCSCRRTKKAEETGGEFEPKEMLGFVRDLAVCSWVDIEDSARAAKMLGQVNGYRHYASVCGTSDVDEGVCVENMLGFVENVAVSWGGSEWQDVGVGREVAQINAYRRFVCMRPNWVYRASLQVEDGNETEEDEGTSSMLFGSLLVFLFLFIINL